MQAYISDPNQYKNRQHEVDAYALGLKNGQTSKAKARVFRLTNLITT
jgi:hypothetical protein